MIKFQQDKILKGKRNPHNEIIIFNIFNVYLSSNINAFLNISDSLFPFQSRVLYLLRLVAYMK